MAAELDELVTAVCCELDRRSVLYDQERVRGFVRIVSPADYISIADKLEATAEWTATGLWQGLTAEEIVLRD